MSTYLFYDIETSGLNKAFDQVVQFCAIRTDTSFREIERTNLTVRLRPDTVISPGALITHRIGISELQGGLCEYEATGRIHRLLNEPGTISLGYNTMGFDDEFLRFAFHRNLFPPYTHQYSNGCGRMDLLPITTLYHLYKPEALNWPVLNGKPTLKLEHLSSANHLCTGRAHDAQTDVLATLELARKLSEHQDMWRYLSGCFHKATDADRVSRLPVAHQSLGCRHTTGLIVSSEFGPELQYQAPVLYLGDSIPYGNQSLWLRLDLPELQGTTPGAIPETTWVIRKRMGDPPIMLPPHARYLALLDENRKTRMQQNLAWIIGNEPIFREIVDYYRQFTYPEIPDLDPDAALYQMGFMSHAEMNTCRAFHMVDPTEKAEVVAQFQREEIRQLAARILFRNYPSHGPSHYRQDFSAYMRRINAPGQDEALCDFKGAKRITPLTALAECRRLSVEADLDPEQRHLLTELVADLQQRFDVDIQQG